MRAPVKNLGIFITSDRFPEYALPLAQAASRRGLMVRVHLTGPGVRLVQEAGFEQLAALGAVSICRESATRFLGVDYIENLLPGLLVPPHHMAWIIQACERHLFI